MTREPGIDYQRTVTYKPSSMTFKEFDKKMKYFRPDLQYWEKRKKKKHANGNPTYTADETKILLSTDHIAQSVYVLGNGGPTDVYTNQDTAYEIREALRARLEITEQWGLTTLTKKFNNVVRANQHACPDIRFDCLQYYK
jgi:hypothetical protein